MCRTQGDENVMKNSAPIGLGIVVVAGLFGLVGGVMALVAWDFTVIGALFLAAIIALIVAIVLWLGWRPANTNDEDMTAQAHRAGQAPTVPASGATSPVPAAPAAAAPTPPASPAPATPKPEPTPALAPAAKAAPAVEPAAADPVTGEDYDGDGVVEGADEGTKPATLSAARDGGPDDLKQIKGVGPKMEGMLHDMGFYHFDQVAAWTGQEVAWVDANLKGFKGRVSRDNWVDQAKTLAAGGETEFSKKVEKGGVY